MPGRMNPFSDHRGGPEPDEEVVEVVEIVEPVPPPLEPDAVRLQRERMALTRQREIEMRDVGGLTVEMVRRDRWKPDLLISRAGRSSRSSSACTSSTRSSAAEATARTFPYVAHCKCGAPLAPGVHFCSHCGRPAATTPAVVTCAHCGQPLPADVNFCPFCGNPAAPADYAPAPDPLDETMIRPDPNDPEGRL